jgi:hypothetical protein
MKKIVVIFVVVVIFAVILLIAFVAVNIINGTRVSRMCDRIIKEFHKITLDKKDVFRNYDFFSVVLSRTGGFSLMNAKEAFKIAKTKLSDKTITVYDKNIPKKIRFGDILKYVDSPDEINVMRLEKGLNEVLNNIGILIKTSVEEKPSKG